MNKYNKKLENEIYNLIRKENLTLESLSESLNINYDELKNYMDKNSKRYRKKLIKKIKSARNEYLNENKIKIENALIKKALGFYSKDIIKETKIDKEGKETSSIIKVYKYNSPNERAIIIFLDILNNKFKKSKKSKENKNNEEIKKDSININIGFDN